MFWGRKKQVREIELNVDGEHGSLRWGVGECPVARGVVHGRFCDFETKPLRYDPYEGIVHDDDTGEEWREVDGLILPCFQQGRNHE